MRQCDKWKNRTKCPFCGNSVRVVHEEVVPGSYKAPPVAIKYFDCTAADHQWKLAWVATKKDLKRHAARVVKVRQAGESLAAKGKVG